MKHDNIAITVMMQDEHDDYVGGGCDPHCHVCDKKINVGDRWTLKVFIPATVAPSGLVARVRGMCCEECAMAGRDLPAPEQAALESRLRVALNNPPPAKPAAPAVAHHGCFVLDDGTKF